MLAHMLATYFSHPTIHDHASILSMPLEGDSGRKVYVLGCDSIGHCEKKFI
jgi:hypothetical protein